MLEYMGGRKQKITTEYSVTKAGELNYFPNISNLNTRL